MHPTNRPMRPTRPDKRNRCSRAAVIAPLAAALTLLTGCPDDVQKEFRDAAGESLEQGVNAILDGFVTGVFAVFEPEDQAETGA